MSHYPRDSNSSNETDVVGLVDYWLQSCALGVTVENWRFPDELWQEIVWKKRYLQQLDEKEADARLTMHYILLEISTLRDPWINDIPTVTVEVIGDDQFTIFGDLCLLRVWPDNSIFDTDDTVSSVAWGEDADIYEAESTGLS
jgi:hypothetical protein